jgi:hypothetical protein
MSAQGIALGMWSKIIHLAPTGAALIIGSDVVKGCRFSVAPLGLWDIVCPMTQGDALG